MQLINHGVGRLMPITQFTLSPDQRSPYGSNRNEKYVLLKSLHNFILFSFLFFRFSFFVGITIDPETRRNIQWAHRLAHIGTIDGGKKKNKLCFSDSMWCDGVVRRIVWDSGGGGDEQQRLRWYWNHTTYWYHH